MKQLAYQLLFTLLIVFVNPAWAQETASCPLVTKGVMFKYEVRAATSSLNCLVLEGGKDLQEIIVVAIHYDATPFTLKISTPVINGSSELVSSTLSDASGVVAKTVYPAGRELIFSAPPVGNDGIHRNYTVGYIVVDNTGYLTVRVERITPGRELPRITSPP